MSHVSVEGLYSSAEAEMRLFATQQATRTLPAGGVEDRFVWTVAMLKAAEDDSSALVPSMPPFQAFTLALSTKDEICSAGTFAGRVGGKTSAAA